MALVQHDLQTLPGKLCKSLKKLQSDQSPERVHQVRTRTRRLEVLLHALALDTSKKDRRLLKAIKPVRKKSGKVRDADVLIAFASQVQPEREKAEDEKECHVRLLEHLGAQRLEGCGKLARAVSWHTRQVKRRSKRFERFLADAVEGKNGKSKNGKKKRTSAEQLSEEAAVYAMHLAGELRKWPPLGRSNLHPFRLKVKELRYLLQLGEHEDRQFVKDLGEVKDAIGEWHDWEDLATTAEQAISHRGCAVIKAIRAKGRQNLRVAIDSANRLRQQYFTEGRKSRKQPASAKAPDQNESVLASAALAA